MDVVFSHIEFCNMERWVEKLCFLKALFDRLFHIRFQDLSSVFGTPDYMVFKLVYRVIQTEDSHALQHSIHPRITGAIQMSRRPLHAGFPAIKKAPHPALACGVAFWSHENPK